MGIFRDDNNNNNEYTGPTGDPLHDAVYGWDMDSNSISDDYGSARPLSHIAKRDNYSKKAWDCYLHFEEEDALYYIDLALDLDEYHSNNWNIKAIILQAMKRYGESERCYDRSLELSLNYRVCDNKVRMLYEWANQLIEESKRLPNGLGKLEEAKEKNMKAITSRHGEERYDKYLEQKDTIDFYIDYEMEYQRNLETLKSFDKSELFTITGRRFCKNDMDLTPGMPLKLVKEPDNEHDKDAIAVYAQGEKIGYVANGSYTKHELTSSASELQDKIQDTSEGQYLFHLQRHADIQFSIGKIKKNKMIKVRSSCQLPH